MASTEFRTIAPPLVRPRFQFSLATLLLLFVVLGSSLAVFGAWGIVIFLLVAALAIFIRGAKSLLTVFYIVLGLFGLACLGALLTPAASCGGASLEAQCKDNLHQIAMAVEGYREAHGHYPPAYLADKDGKPLVSWRVLILPYLDQDALYKSFDLTEPWDGPKNKKLSATPLRIFTCPSELKANSANAAPTSYLAVVGENAAWRGDKPAIRDDIGRDPVNTVVLIEVSQSGINWAEPRDLSLDDLAARARGAASPIPSNDHREPSEFFFTYDNDRCVSTAFADCSVASLRLGSLSPDELRKALEVGGFREDSEYANLDGPVRHINWRNIAALAVWLLSVGVLLVRAARGKKSRGHALTDAAVCEGAV